MVSLVSICPITLRIIFPCCLEEMMDLTRLLGSALTCNTGYCGFRSTLGVAGCCTETLNVNAVSGCAWATSCYASTDLDACSTTDCNFGSYDLLWSVPAAVYAASIGYKVNLLTMTLSAPEPQAQSASSTPTQTLGRLRCSARIVAASSTLLQPLKTLRRRQQQETLALVQGACSLSPQRLK